MRIFVRYQEKEEWSQDKNDYREISVPDIMKIENEMDDSTVVKIQAFKHFRTHIWYILAILETQQDKGEQVKWLVHVHCGDDGEKILMFEKCKNFDPPVMDYLPKLDTKCTETVESFLCYVKSASSVDDTNEFAQELINEIRGETRPKWMRSCPPKQEDWVADDDNPTARPELEVEGCILIADDDNPTDRPELEVEGGCKLIADNTSPWADRTTVTLPVKDRKERCVCEFNSRNFWEGKFIYREARECEYVNLFEGDIDNNSKFRTLFEVENLLGRSSRIRKISLCKVSTRSFCNGQITERFTVSSNLLMLKIKSSSEESNRDGTWWTFFLNGYQDTTRNGAFNWYVLLHKHSEVVTSTLKTKSQLVKIKELKRDESLQCVDRLCTYLKEQFIPLYQRNYIPGNTFHFSQEIFKRLSKNVLHFPRFLRLPGPHYQSSWEGKIVFYEDGNRQEYTVDNITQLRQDLDPNQLRVIGVEIYKSPLAGWLDIPHVAYHPYVLFHTSDDRHWSIDKYPCELILQRSFDEKEVKEKTLGQQRFCKSKFCRRQASKCIISDVSNCLLSGVLRYLETSGELQSPYVLTTDNCMRFAEVMFNRMASNEKWKLPAIVELANKATNKIHGGRNFRQRLFTN